MYSECTECLHASRTCSRFCCSWMMINAVDICAMRSQLVALLDLIMCLAAPATMNSMSPVGTHAHMIGSTPLTVTSAGCGSAVFCCSCNPAVHAGMMDAEVALFFSRAAGDADAYNSDGATQESSLVPATAVALTSCYGSARDQNSWLLALEPLLARNQCIYPGPHSQCQSVKTTARTVIMALFISST